MNNWITCEYCGEKRNTSGDYTSPANREKDHRDWEREHVSAKCVRWIDEFEVI